MLQLRRHPTRLLYMLIAGVPVDLAPAPGEPIEWARLTGDEADPRVTEMIDPTIPTLLTPSCNTARGISFPPVRLLRVAEGLEREGARVVLGSICQESYRAPLASLPAASR